MKTNCTTQGFALLETLIIIAIYGATASLGIASYSDTKAEDLDTVRLGDMHAIETALEQHFNEHGYYPGDASSPAILEGQLIGVGNPIDTVLAPYLETIPKDPRHDAGDGLKPAPGSLYFYSYSPNHCLQEKPGYYSCSESCTDTTTTGATIGFNKAARSDNMQKDTYAGCEMNLNNADFNILKVNDSTVSDAIENSY